MNLETLFPEIITSTNEPTPEVVSEVKKVEEEIVSEVVEKEPDSPQEVFVNDYEKTLEDLHSSGVLGLDSLPEEYAGKDLTAEDTINILSLALKNKEEDFRNREKDVSQATFEDVVENMTDIVRRAYLFEQENNDPEDIKDFLRGLVFEQDILSIDVGNNPEKVIFEWNKANGLSSEESKEMIEDLKTLNKLEKKAAEIKPLLDKKVTEIANQKLKEQNDLLELEKQAKVNVFQKLHNVFEKGSLGKLDPIHKEFLQKVLVEDEIPVPYKGKTIKVGGAEYLTMYHKFSDKGNLEHLAKALLFLQFPETFEKQIVEKVEQKATNNFIRDHKVSGNIKAGLFQEKETSTRTLLPLR